MPAFLIPLDAGGTVIPLEKSIVLVGRQADCDVVLTHSRKVSRKHCCFAQVNDRWIIRDLGSTNGVSINGARIRKEHRLRLGDEILIGDIGFKLHNKPQLVDNKIVETAGFTPALRASATSPVSSELPLAIPESDAEMPRYSLPSTAFPGNGSPASESGISRRKFSDHSAMNEPPRGSQPLNDSPRFDDLFSAPNDDSGVDLNGHHGKRRDDSHEMLAVGSDSFG